MTQDEKDFYLRAVPDRLLALKKAIGALDEEVAGALQKLREEKVISGHQVGQLEKMRLRARLDFMDSHQRFNLVCQKIYNELKKP